MSLITEQFALLDKLKHKFSSEYVQFCTTKGKLPYFAGPVVQLRINRDYTKLDARIILGGARRNTSKFFELHKLEIKLDHYFMNIDIDPDDLGKRPHIRIGKRLLAECNASASYMNSVFQKVYFPEEGGAELAVWIRFVLFKGTTPQRRKWKQVNIDRLFQQGCYAWMILLNEKSSQLKAIYTGPRGIDHYSTDWYPLTGKGLYAAVKSGCVYAEAQEWRKKELMLDMPLKTDLVIPASGPVIQKPLSLTRPNVVVPEKLGPAGELSPEMLDPNLRSFS